MAYPYRGGPKSPREEQPVYTNFSGNPLSPPRNPNRLSGGMPGPAASMNAATSEARSGLTRRFTTNALPTLSPIGQQRRLAAGEAAQSNQGSRLPPAEREYRHYEQLLAEQRRIQAFIEQVDPDTRREVEDNMRHEHAVAQMIAQSEPTTPPEYADAFPSALSKPNRYSSSSVMSPPGITNRGSRSNTQLTSPAGHYAQACNGNNASNIPSQSVPGSRRHSDDEEEDDDFLFDFNANAHRAAANPNRKSMPVTSYDRTRSQVPDLSSVLGSANNSTFFYDEDNQPSSSNAKTKASPSDGKTYLQVQHTADGFPKLIRREENGSASYVDPAAALDLVLTANGEQQVADRATAARHRISLPPSALRKNEANYAGISSVLNEPTFKSASNNRRSVEFNLATEAKRPSLLTSPPRGIANGNGIAHHSRSTNDIPTLQRLNGTHVTSPLKSAVRPVTSQLATTAENSPHFAAANINASHNPTNGHRAQVSQASNQQLTDTQANSQLPSSTHQDTQPGFQPSASSFIPSHYTNENFMMSPYAQSMYGGYGLQTPVQTPMHSLNNGFGGMNLNGGFTPAHFQSPYAQVPYAGGMYQQQFNNGPAMGGAPRMHGNYNGSTQQHRKFETDDKLARFSATSVDQLRGEILGLCTDQQGCRFLQRKLDERDLHSVQVIFEEASPHIVKLMTDPFGNYLCQKLLENCDDDQRTTLIRNCMAQMTQIALNQHGTRALQKMIEFVSTDEQIQLIIEAMRFDVVQLIQDLNGNHVIQKCLNHLTSANAQFIFDAVGVHCVAVGTHRHGCCVLQRCVDHASGLQKGKLIRQISQNALNLVQDPFGNYVVQYILDIQEPLFTEPMCEQFFGKVVFLSKQKFSSNVIEKAIRCANEQTRRLLITELMVATQVEGMIRDTFGNYVVQTAFDFADDEQKIALADAMRPLLPGIRGTPYGRRLISKVMDFDGRTSGLNSGVMTPDESYNASNGPTFPQPFPAIQNAPTGRGNRNGWIGNGQQQYANGNGQTFTNGNHYGRGVQEIMAPQPKRHSGTLGGMIEPISHGGYGTPSTMMPVDTFQQQQQATAYTQNGAPNGFAGGPNGYANGNTNGFKPDTAITNGGDAPPPNNNAYRFH
nr:hypothetical protein B0A51_02350 [Rachicladosporium sp. CCFEE 5018]